MLRSECIEGGGGCWASRSIASIAIACIAGIYSNPERNSAKKGFFQHSIVDSVPTSPIVIAHLRCSRTPYMALAPPEWLVARLASVQGTIHARLLHCMI